MNAPMKTTRAREITVEMATPSTSKWGTSSQFRVGLEVTARTCNISGVRASFIARNELAMLGTTAISTWPIAIQNR